MLARIFAASGTYASRRFVDWVTHPEDERIQRLIEISRMDEHGLVGPFQREQPSLLNPSLLEKVASENDVRDIFQYMDGKLNSTKIYRVKKLLREDGVKEAVLKQLDKRQTEIDPITPGNAWEKQDLSDNCAPTLISVVSKQHGIYSDESLATLRTLISGKWGHEPDCLDLFGIFVTCRDGSSLVGVTVKNIEAAFEVNNIPVSTVQVSSFAELDALLATGRSVCLLVDARPLWAPLSPQLSDVGRPLGHIIQVVSRTTDGDGYIALDTGHSMGREIVYSQAQLERAWAAGDFRAIVTDNPVPGWEAQVIPQPRVEPTADSNANDLSAIFQYGYIDGDAIEAAIEAAIETVESVENTAFESEVRAARLMDTGEASEIILEPVGQVGPDGQTPPDDAVDTETEGGDFIL